MSRPSRLAARIAAICLLGAAGGLTATTARADPSPTCGGEPATLVGEPGHNKLEGTPARDVIVSNGAALVLAGAGNDLICVTGQTFGIDAGDGDDVVMSETTAAHLDAELGGGVDTFTGNGAEDFVGAGTLVDFGGEDASHDEIHTGAGDDIVYSGGPADPSQPNDDLLDLGDGADHLYLAGDAATADIDGGPDDNALTLEVCCKGGPLLVDNVTQHVWASSQPDPTHLVATYSGDFTYFGLGIERAAPPYSSIGFRGSGRAEHVFLSHRYAHDDPRSYEVDLDLGSGDDSVDAEQYELRGTINGGPGVDDLTFASWATVAVAVRLGRGITTDGERTATLAGVQNTTLYVKRRMDAVLSGSGAANRLAISEGHRGSIMINGNGGADRLDATLADRGITLSGSPGDDRGYGSDFGDIVRGGTGADQLHGLAGRDRLYGGPGNDSLLGGGDNDVLRGQRGHDRADGSHGNDVCTAEVRHSCHLP